MGKPKVEHQLADSVHQRAAIKMSGNTVPKPDRPHGGVLRGNGSGKHRVQITRLEVQRMRSPTNHQKKNDSTDSWKNDQTKRTLRGDSGGDIQRP